MPDRYWTSWVSIGSLLLVTSSFAGEAPPAESDPIAVAIRQAIPLLERGTAGSADQRTCFTCHNQAVPVFALAEARRRGFEVDQDNLERQIRHTADHLKRGLQNYRDGRGQGGKVISAGYALWTLEAGGSPPDEVTEAVAGYLLEYQKDQSRWSHPGRRPPSSGSDYTATYVALRGLGNFATADQQPGVKSRSERVAEWLLQESPRETEDHVFRLWSLHHVGADREQIQQAVETLLALQRDDGGWGQTVEMASDAYATGTVLSMLLETDVVSRKHAAVAGGIAWLCKAQLPDGSWHVVTRAEPFQTYYESGFPHGKDQFLSMAASGWATLALLLALDESP